MEAPEVKVERRTHEEDDGKLQEHDPSYEEAQGEAAEEEEDQGLEDKLQRLNLMLQQATAYSQFISQRIRLPGLPNQLPPEAVPPVASSSTAGSTAGSSRTGRSTTPNKNKGRGKGKRPRSEESEEQQKGEGEEEEDLEAKQRSEQNGGKRKRQKTDAIGQPEMLTGGALRDYQLTGVAWLASLYENGINGILADEMGLGKTIQTVAFLTYLYAKGVKGPFLVVGPLSTLANWVKEIQKWAPAMPVLLYHGTKDERIELRKKALPAIISSKQGIVVTSFEITIKDRSALQRKRWKYIILDEGHRIKNMNCRLVKELKAYDSANRLLLTGTPLQNNLTELWSLLSFLMPSIFDDLEAFQRWFNFEGVGREEGNRRILTAERENQLVTKLHTILQPFLLRRVKTDVEMDLPKKEERIINTILTPAQQRLYQATLNGQLHELLATSKAKARCPRGTGLQNLIMQLRKCCNHPYLFEWPVDDQGEEVVDERLVETSGKLQMLDRLLPRLREEGHKVLLFSQMTRMLDILEDYMHLRQFPYFRLDGTTPQPERQAQIEEFNNATPTTNTANTANTANTSSNGSNDGNDGNTAGTEVGGAFCFLLSTRAGGLGINLTAANVVVFVDSDWNPQMDLQAQDRAHRIGQTRNVRVYRLVTGNSVEAKIVERAAHKMKLGALVLAGTAHARTATANANANATDDDRLDELSDLLHDSTLLQPLTEPPPITDELLFDWD